MIILTDFWETLRQKLYPPEDKYLPFSSAFIVNNIPMITTYYLIRKLTF